jgi:hypothetical protein
MSISGQDVLDDSRVQGNAAIKKAIDEARVAASSLVPMPSSQRDRVSLVTEFGSEWRGERTEMTWKPSGGVDYSLVCS